MAPLLRYFRNEVPLGKIVQRNVSRQKDPTQNCLSPKFYQSLGQIPIKDRIGQPSCMQCFQLLFSNEKREPCELLLFHNAIILIDMIKMRPSNMIPTKLVESGGF